MGKSSKDKRDIYYRLAKENGYRARSAYKLIQLNALYHFLDDADSVLDLCAAPGSWSQVVSQVFFPITASTSIDTSTDSHTLRNEKRLVAIDLQTMAPLPHTIQLQGDLTAPSTQDKLMALFPSGVDVVICDGAPDVTGLHDLDTFLHHQLFSACLHVVTRVLKQGGTFVAKMFMGGEDELVQEMVGCWFEYVSWHKPLASRASSMETFLVCQGFYGPGEAVREDAAFLAHGDLSMFNSA